MEKAHLPWAFFSAEKCWMRASAETPKPAVLPVTSPAHLQSTDAPCYSSLSASVTCRFGHSHRHCGRAAMRPRRRLVRPSDHPLKCP